MSINIYRAGSYYYTNADGSIYKKGASTYTPPAELLDSDNEEEVEDETYEEEDDEGEEATGTRGSTAQQTASRTGAYYEEEDSPNQIVQLDQGAGGQLDSVQYERHHEEAASDDEGEGYSTGAVEEEGSYSYGEDD